MADVAHRKLGVALGEGQKLVQGRWRVLRHDPDSFGTGMSGQAPLASLRWRKQHLGFTNQAAWT
jgi:hypothetical protein